jgi:hypothetical protein
LDADGYVLGATGTSAAITSGSTRANIDANVVVLNEYLGLDAVPPAAVAKKDDLFGMSAVCNDTGGARARGRKLSVYGGFGATDIGDGGSDGRGDGGGVGSADEQPPKRKPTDQATPASVVATTPSATTGTTVTSVYQNLPSTLQLSQVAMNPVFVAREAAAIDIHSALASTQL